MRRARRDLSIALASGLRKVGKDVAKQVRAFGKAKGVEDLDLDGLSILIDPTEKQLKRVVKDTSSKVLGQLGAEELTNQVNEKAADWATARAAEMVGMKYNEDGELVENTRAEYAIDQTTRDLLRSTISDGLEENIGWEEIAADIEENFAFSEARATAIARSETTNANNQASLMSAHEANDELGIGLKKGWLATDTACDICMENEAAGLLELDEEFPSGDDAPGAHTNCECTLIYEREGPNDDSET